MKKLTSMLLVVMMLVLSTIPALATEPTMEEKMNVLINEGLDPTFVEGRSDSTIDKLYQAALSGTILVGEETTEILTITEETANGTRGTIPSSEMVLTSVPLVICDSTSTYVDSVIIIIDYEWEEGHPIMKGTDAISANWDHSVFSYVPYSFESTNYEFISGQGWTVDNTNYVLSAANQGGLGFDIELPGTSGFSSKGIRGEAAFDLEPAIPMRVNGNYSTNINIQYAHDGNPTIIDGFSFTYDDYGVSIDVGSLTDTAAASILLHYGR